MRQWGTKQTLQHKLPVMPVMMPLIAPLLSCCTKTPPRVWSGRDCFSPDHLQLAVLRMTHVTKQQHSKKASNSKSSSSRQCIETTYYPNSEVRKTPNFISTIKIFNQKKCCHSGQGDCGGKPRRYLLHQHAVSSPIYNNEFNLYLLTVGCLKQHPQPVSTATTDLAVAVVKQ
jgi:hypothetical protein